MIHQPNDLDRGLIGIDEDQIEVMIWNC